MFISQSPRLGFLRDFFDLTKIGIVIFAVLSGLAGYVTAFASETTFSWVHLTHTLLGLYFLSSGSLALNQAQEWKIDARMDRTKNRPIAAGRLKPIFGFAIGIVGIVIGLIFLNHVSLASMVTGLICVLLYNGVYTYWWKPYWVFGAVPGAIPGALPVTIGYAANDYHILNSDSVYLFLIMLLWQIPHFWVLAVKYREDYAKGGFPVLPAVRGVPVTIFYIGIYTYAYVAIAVAAPWFVHSSWIYLGIVFPFVFFILKSFYAYSKSNGEVWFRFFMWLNFSMLLFLFVPVCDRWNFLFVNSN